SWPRDGSAATVSPCRAATWRRRGRPQPRPWPPSARGFQPASGRADPSANWNRRRQDRQRHRSPPSQGPRHCLFRTSSASLPHLLQILACRYRRIGPNTLNRPLAMLQPPTVLNGPIVHGLDRLAPERYFRHLGPARIDECLAPDGNEVGPFLAQDVLGKVRVNNQAHRHRHDSGLPAHALGERYLKPPRPLDARGGSRAVKTTRGTIDDVDASRLQFLGVGNGIVQIPAALDAVDRRDAQEQGLALGPGGAHGLGNLQRKARAARKVTAVAIAARVAKG